MKSHPIPNLIRLCLAIPVAGSLLFLAACGPDEKETSAKPDSEPTAAASNPLVADVFLGEKPEGAAQSVLELRKAGKPGDAVIVTGKIGGAVDPFTEGFATFVLADTSLRTCDLIPGDSCETPWDACCEAPEVIKASRITVQVLDGESGPVAASLRAVKGLSELDQLVVTGTVAEGSTAENLILNASGIFLEKEWVAPAPEGKAKG